MRAKIIQSGLLRNCCGQRYVLGMREIKEQNFHLKELRKLPFFNSWREKSLRRLWRTNNISTGKSGGGLTNFPGKKVEQIRIRVLILTDVIGKVMVINLEASKFVSLFPFLFFLKNNVTYILGNRSGNCAWELCISSAQVVCCALGLKQPLAWKEGVDRPEMQWTISTFVGFSRAQITHWEKEYFVRDNIKAISTIVIF